MVMNFDNSVATLRSSPSAATTMGIDVTVMRMASYTDDAVEEPGASSSAVTPVLCSRPTQRVTKMAVSEEVCSQESGSSLYACVCRCRMRATKAMAMATTICDEGPDERNMMIEVKTSFRNISTNSHHQTRSEYLE